MAQIAVVWANLRRFIEDDQVEMEFGAVEVGADCERTHHHARLQARQHPGDVCKKSTQREVALLLVYFAKQDTEFGTLGSAFACLWSFGMGQQLTSNPGRSGPNCKAIQFREPRDQPLVAGRGETSQHGDLLVQCIEPESIEASPECIRCKGRGVFA